METKLQKALKPNEDGFVSAKNLYELLGLDPTHYSRWCKSNFFTDFGIIDGVKPSNGALAIDGERMNTGIEQPNPSQDYLITVRIAEKICLKTKSEFKYEILEYFLDLEEAVPKAALAIEQNNETIKMLVGRVEQLGKFLEETSSRLLAIESDRSVPGGKVSDWFKEACQDIDELIKQGEWGTSYKSVLEYITHRMGTHEGVNFGVYSEQYKKDTGTSVTPQKLYVIDYYDETRCAFEKVVGEMFSCFEDSSAAADEVALQAQLEEEMFTPPEGYSYPDEIAGIPGRGVPTPEEIAEFEKKQRDWQKKELERVERIKDTYWGEDGFQHFYDEEKEKERIAKQREFVRQREERQKMFDEMRKKYPNNIFLNPKE